MLIELPGTELLPTQPPANNYIRQGNPIAKRAKYEKLFLRFYQNIVPMVL